jgi:large subunit ribosomal protein L4
VLSAKARDNELLVLQQLELAEPKTREMVRILDSLGVESTALVVTSQPEENVIKSARNLPGIKTMPANLLNVADLLNYDRLLMTVAAVRKAEELWGNGVAQGGNDASL